MLEILKVLVKSGIGMILIAMLRHVLVTLDTNADDKKTEKRKNTEYKKIYSDDILINPKYVIAQIKEADPFFNDEMFLNRVKRIFKKSQELWSKREWNEMRIYETKELFEQHFMQIKNQLDNKQINMKENIIINYAKIYKFKKDNSNYMIDIILNVSMNDYVVDENTGKVISGKKKKKAHKMFLMTFIKKRDYSINEENEVIRINCPNCGAPMLVAEIGRCEYCATMLTNEMHNWLLSNIEPFEV